MDAPEAVLLSHEREKGRNACDGVIGNEAKVVRISIALLRGHTYVCIRGCLTMTQHPQWKRWSRPQPVLPLGDHQTYLQIEQRFREENSKFNTREKYKY